MSDHESYRLSVRFGEEILARGHTAIPNLVLNYYVRLGLSGPELLFTIHVWQHWWSDRDPYPSLRTIAARMGISVRQAKRYVEALEGKGFLRVIERFLPDGSQTTNEFDYSPLIRAVVKEARADGALEPGTGPVIHRRTRSRTAPGDNLVIPPPDGAVTPADGATVTGPTAMAATGSPSTVSPKENDPNADPNQKDGEATADGALAEVLDLFATATERPVTTAERETLAGLLETFAPRAARLMPPASATEWLAVALAELVEAHGTAVTVNALGPVLGRHAATAETDASLRRKGGSERQQLAAAKAEQPGGRKDSPGLTSIWRTTLDDLREQVVPANFTRWFARTELLRHEGGQAVIGVPDRISADQLARRFDPLVRRALGDACGEPVTVQYEVTQR